MCNAAIPTADEITRLQTEAVQRWHLGPIDQPYESFLGLVCKQHECNFRLWHEEDQARSRSASDREIANVKRAIDKLNQERNDRIEQLDDAIAVLLDQGRVVTAAHAKLNSETLGSVIDRLSIMSLRIYHYREQLDRLDADSKHKPSVSQRLVLCQQQMADLSGSLQALIDDIFSGQKRHKTYRQMKMYNDPALNPLIDGESR